MKEVSFKEMSMKIMVNIYLIFFYILELGFVSMLKNDWV